MAYCIFVQSYSKPFCTAWIVWMGSRSACSSPRALSSEQISPTRRYSDTVGVFICCLEPVGGLCYAYLVDRCAHDICSIRFCCHTSLLGGLLVLATFFF